MEFGFLFKGMGIGVAVAAPVGPIGLLCIQRTLNDGRINGLLSGLGAATADAVFGFIAAFGLTLVSTFMLAQKNWLAGIGGLYLLYLGVQMMRTSSTSTELISVETSVAELDVDETSIDETSATSQRSTALSAYASTFLLTLTNPMTILAFLAIYAGLGLAAGTGDYGSATLLVMGVFLGSAGWWLLLSGVADRLRHRVDARVLRWVNLVAGVVVIGFGLFALIGITL